MCTGKDKDKPRTGKNPRRNVLLDLDGAFVCKLVVQQLGMRESGYSLSPLYLKPVLIVGKFVRLSAGILNVSIFFRYLREFVKKKS